MTNLTSIPLEDWFETSLSQSYDWQLWTVNVNKVPNFTFPVWETTFIVINPKNDNIQIAEIDSYDAVLKTLNVSNITLEKWAWVNSTAQDHPVNSTLIISNNYQFWKNIKDAINSKIDADDWLWVIYADETARDAVITSPTNWMQVYVTSLWLFTDYIGWTWTNRATWSTPNASEAVAGKVEMWTQTEFNTQVTTWWTWAELTFWADKIIGWASYIWIPWELKLWTIDTPPASWLIADWSAINRITYAILFAVIWTTYWVWDGSTTFNIPDLTGNTPVGKDWATFNALWDTWGTETHTLTTGEIPSHNHNVLVWSWLSNEAIWATNYLSASSSAWNTMGKNSNDTVNTTMIQVSWWWASHNILQPYLVINYIIKT